MKKLSGEELKFLSDKIALNIVAVLAHFGIEAQVFDDYVTGLNHTGGLFSCISQDQINAVNKTRTCLDDNTTHNKCYSSQGAIISPGASISYPSSCNNIPKCKGILGNISLNFKLENNE